MRIITRLSILVLAMFLALAPSFAMAQTTGGGGTTSGTTSGGNSGTTSGSNGSGTTSGTTGSAPSTSTSTTTSNTTDTSNVNWTWIIVGAVVLVVIVGLVAMSNN